ncbi:MAG: hypothetical protein B6D44_11075 [Ignavibacteriales bacterium UTCHB2]|jgi:Ni/Co efflux regulator RcnB|nr:MAG: hypothetical protein BWY38_00138 [Ignavibacteria bacterium ADurb.Bin266]OQY71864.1 MAG: hypothetical protein B6D44_11075 [Ignavibacteriales bacterium UTCHB2]HQI41526.1 heavy metal-binding domain-containing protein [Ignavibacteriaceae bacterium]HQJ45603.1 heavy metal-binding domain-containing protein [Ignavibacteriaceae bacterium]
MLKQFVIAFVFVSFFGAFIFAQEKPETEKKNDSNKTEQMKHDTDKDKVHHEKKSENSKLEMHHMKSNKNDESDIIRKDEIDLVSIDQNKDGKVYQDQMCWNVISDKPGECPQCGMILKEVSLDKAKENLLKHDFKVKKN